MGWGSTSIAGIIIIYTGELEALREPYPRLLRFARYLQRPGRRRRLAAGREPGHSLRLDGPYRLPAPAPQAMRLQPLCRRGHGARACAPSAAPSAMPARRRPSSSSAGNCSRPRSRRFWSPERRTLRQQSAVAGGGENAAHLRPLAGHRHPLRPVPRRPKRRRTAVLGGVSAGDGLFLSRQCRLAAVGAGQGRARRHHRRGPAPALGDDGLGEAEQHLAGGLEGRAGLRPRNGATARSCRFTSPTTA